MKSFHGLAAYFNVSISYLKKNACLTFKRIMFRLSIKFSVKCMIQTLDLFGVIDFRKVINKLIDG